MIRPRRRAQGFSLIELMMVVSIIGVMTALIGPGLSSFLADTRASGAAEAVVRVQRQVRARVTATGLAHLLVYSATANNNLGTLNVYEGMNNHCATTPWAATMDANAATNGHFPVEQLLMDLYNRTRDGTAPAASDSSRQVIRLIARQGDFAGTPLTGFGLCFQPNGQTFEDTTVDATWTFTPHRATYLFEIWRRVNSVKQGLDRRIILPPGGNARHLI